MYAAIALALLWLSSALTVLCTGREVVAFAGLSALGGAGLVGVTKKEKGK